MRKRNIRIQCWLSKKEADSFNKRVSKSGLSKEAYLRHLITGFVPQDAPSPDYFTMMREIHNVRNTLADIAATARTQGLDTERYEAECIKLDKNIKVITDAVLLPIPIK